MSDRKLKNTSFLPSIRVPKTVVRENIQEKVQNMLNTD